MKKNIIVLFLIVCFFGGTQLLSFQEEEKKEEAKQELNKITKKLKPPYSPRGRRDPFRDLLEGREVERKTEAGEPLLYIEDVKILGMIKSKGDIKVSISGPEGFPITISEGYQFADGFVLSINSTQITLRKTKERGIKLFKPRDIVKKFNP
jgi:Tfp pilus assembly protein PilP